MTESVKIDKEIVDKLRKLKKAKGVSIQAFIEQTLREKLKRYKWLSND